MNFTRKELMEASGMSDLAVKALEGRTPRLKSVVDHDTLIVELPDQALVWVASEILKAKAAAWLTKAYSHDPSAAFISSLFSTEQALADAPETKKYQVCLAAANQLKEQWYITVSEEGKE